MSYENPETEFSSFGSGVPASTSYALPVNPFTPPMCTVPYSNYGIPPPPYVPSNPSMVVQGQQPNVYIPPYPPPYPPPFNFEQSSISSSNTSYSQESGFAIFQPQTSDLGLGASTNYSYFQGSPFFPALNSDTMKQDIQESFISDESWIKEWLIAIDFRRRQQNETQKTVKIHQVKEHLKKCLELLKELDQLREKLSERHREMDDQIWNALTSNFLKRKNQVTDYISTLPNLNELQKVIAKRCKKRKGQKSRKIRRREIREESREKKLQLHHQIDTWLQDMQKAIDNGKREESLKKEADSILSHVVRKKAEGRRQLSLLTALVKLRQLRAKSADNKGQNISLDDGIRFTKVAEHLKELWEKQMEGYNVEEQGMKVMLNEAVDERDQTRVTRERHIMSQWNRLLFGNENTAFPEFFLAAEKNGEAFVGIRQAWDKWLATPDAPVQSNIPIGWVLPCNPSSPEWENLLSAKETT